MKSFKLYLSLLLLMAVGIVGCQDDFDTPPMNVPVATLKPNTTIKDFKAEFWQDAKSYIDTVKLVEGAEHKVIHGRVISSDATGNIYKSLIIQDFPAEDGTPGVALALSINSNSMYTEYRVGQEVVIDLTDMYVGKYQGLMQLGFPQEYSGTWQATFMSYELFQQHTELNGLPEPSKVDTIVTTIKGLPTTPEGIRNMQSQLICFENVKWENAGKTYCDADATQSSGYTNTSRNLIDEEGNKIIVRNSGYATFKAETLPLGNGNVVGILSYYSNAWQLLLRSTDDVIGFSNKPIEGTKTNPYSVEKAIELQGQNKTGWTKGYIVGAVAPGVTSKVTSSSEIEWKAGTALANSIVIAPAADVKDITKCVIVALEDGSSLRSVANLKDNATAYQKEITINGVLTKFMEQAGITTTGTADNYILEGVTPPTPAAGDGSETNPFSVAQIIGGSTGNEMWVQGYIVGCADGLDLTTAIFKAPFTSQTNVLIAASATETAVANCIPVQLPSGDIRTAVNLNANPANLGKVLAIKGNVVKYFGVMGVKEATTYKINGVGPAPAPTGSIYTNKMNTETAFGEFTIQNKTLPAEFTFIWSWGGVNYGAKASAYSNNKNYNSESWLISPELNIAGYSNVTLSFNQAFNKSTNFATHCKLMVSIDGGEFTQVAIPNAPAGTDWTFIESGSIAIKSGSKLKFAFAYNSSETDGGTWEVKNIIVDGKK
ncbi:MAG: DUF5689 domain-containing protein [Muribaculaceae bacterium]|nr:DUF5689 domain-containing protein [Muribaculaceae bacterium]